MFQRLTFPFSALLAAFLIFPCMAQSPVIGGCAVFPADNIWNTPVDQLPASGLSSTYVTTIGPAKTVHADFGSGLWEGGPIGIPYIVVPSTQPKYPATFQYANESDPGPYAIPLTAPIEGGSQSTGDRHALAVQSGNCTLYELYSAYPQTSSWAAGSGAIYNLLSNALRPSGWTSADAAGLPVFAGLVRYDEVAAGEIRHALRFTAPQTQRAFVWPARHHASSLTGSQYPPMGARFRLRASFDISGFSAENQVILRALKKYGMMLADNGSAWYLSGAPDARWNNDDLRNLARVKGSDFEAVDVSGLMVNPDSGQARQSSVVTVTVTPASASVVAGATRQFVASVSNSSDQTVNWSVNGAPGGDSQAGFVSTSGFYTAPASVPEGGTVTVQAASNASPSAVGTATVSITAAPSVPTLSSVTPASGAQGAAVPVTLAGTNFSAGATVAVSGSGVSVSNVAIVNATRITATFTITAAASTGSRTVTVTTAGGTTAARTFTVTAPPSAAPTLTSITPSSGRRGATVSVRLKGTNFTSPAAIAVQGSGVSVSSVVVVNPGLITARFRLGRFASRGSRSVTVSTAAGTSRAVSFTIQ
jgi:hypothetical protein